MDPGLCGSCRHAQVVTTATSRFWLCGRHKLEPLRYRKYAPLPVMRCAGFEASE